METFGRIIVQGSGAGDLEFMLEKPSVTIGRATVNDIVLEDPKVSRTHARLECALGTVTVADLGSSNGIRHGGRRVERAVLTPGDTVGIGGSTIRFEPTTPTHDPQMTVINTEADLHSAIAEDRLSMNLTRTDLPRLAVYTTDRTWELPLLDTVTIGRDEGADVTLPFPQASRRHARIERRGSRFVLRDLNSTNGTWLGERRLDEYALRDGDTLRIGPALLTFKHGFQQEELTVVGRTNSSAGPERPPVIFVPGFGGSELWLNEQRVWPNPKQLVTQSEIFSLKSGAPLDARHITGELVLVPNFIKFDCYNRVGDYLEQELGYERGKDLLEFPYDWRQDNRTSAQRLAQTIEAWDVSAPITIVAHSMGCLVARWYIEKLGGKKKVGRLVMIGGPQLGTLRMVPALVHGRSVLPFGLLGQKLAEILATFPSLYQIQPQGICGVDQYGEPVDLFADDRWLPEAARPLLRDGLAFRRELGTRTSVPAVFVFGYGHKTITSLRVRRDDNGRWQKLEFQIDPTGDDTIPQNRAVLPGAEIHPVHQAHGTIYCDNDVKMRMKLELTRGSTDEG